MTEKRFIVTDWGIGMQITDHQKNKEYSNLDDICEELNALHDDNEQLQLEVNKLTDLIASEIEKNARLLQENNSLKIEKRD